MALPASPPISMSQVYAEFGGAGQPLTAFVRGGAYVPNTGTNAGVPTAPPISLQQLLGAAATIPTTINISNHTVDGTGFVGGGTAVAIFNLLNTGVANGNGDTFVDYPGEWKTGPDAASLYEARWTPVSGPTPTGSAVNTWLNLGTSRGWEVSRSAVGLTTIVGTVEIRRASDGVVLDSATITLSVEISD